MKNEYEKDFEQQFENKIVPILKQLNAKKINHIQNWINPRYLYFLNKSIWFSCSYDWRDSLLEADIGRLYSFRDVMPRIVIIGNYEFFLYELLEMNIIEKEEIMKFNILAEGMSIISKTLEIALKINKQKSKKLDEKLKSEEERLRPYIIQEIIDIKMLEDNIENGNGI